jgi:hypothetical protein
MKSIPTGSGQVGPPVGMTGFGCSCQLTIVLDLKLTLTLSIFRWQAANPFGDLWRKTMSGKKERFFGIGRRPVAAAAMAFLVLANGAARLRAQDSPANTSKEKPSMTTQSKFYCNIKALTPAERARHKELGDKMRKARNATIETPNGYEFQYSPKNVSLAELAEWAVAESKCCPFFDFHIYLENEGTLVCLRLTGSEGVKAFIRAEIGVR